MIKSFILFIRCYPWKLSALINAFTYQKEGRGLCLVEVVSNCPSGWKMTPTEANEWLVENMFPVYPPGDIKTPKE